MKCGARQALDRFEFTAVVRTLASLAVAANAGAQDDPAEPHTETEELEEIVVTGSRIKRRDFTSPSPIATIDRETIAFSGQPTLEETLNRMPQIIPDFGRTSNASGDGTSRINLRGMGPDRTLVLLNGRRLGPSGVGSAVDVNNLPQSLIERVEIITGGATAVYGSDAVAGVVNFITRGDFAGLSMDASASLTEQGDAEIYDLNLAYGHELANTRGNITVYAGIYERKALFGAERPLGRVTLANDDATGTLFEDGSPFVPSGVVFDPRVSFGSAALTTFTPDGIPRQFIHPDDLYNFAPVNYIQTPLTRYSVGVMATLELDSGFELYIESGLANNQVTAQLAAVTAGVPGLVNTDNPVLTPEARQFFIDNFETEPGSGLAFMALLRRFLEVGPRIIDHDRNYWRTVIGIRGDLGGGWDVDGWLTYTRSDEKESFVNDASESRFLQALLVDPVTNECFDPSNGCVPVDPFGEGRISPEAADFLRISSVQNDTERTQMLAVVVVTGSPLYTWAGPLDTAFGVEWRSDDADFKADDVLFTGDTLGFAGDAPVTGTETVIEVYAEAIVPLAENAAWADYLGLEVGGRYSEYDNAGGIWTYKFGGDWQPFSALRFRGMHQRSVRAPNNLELFQENFTETFLFVQTSDGSEDPCSASNDPVGNGNLEKCVLQGLPIDQVGTFQASPTLVDFIMGGNPDLVPETAETFTIGAVVAPDALSGWTISVDFFDLEVRDSIGPIDPLSICFDPANTSNLFCDHVTRDGDPAGAAGNIVELFQPVSNRGLISSRGIDTQVNFETELPQVLSIFAGNAQLLCDVVWTHTLEYEWQQAPFSEIVDCAGFFGGFCAEGTGDLVGFVIPENRITANAHYASGSLGIHLGLRWIEGTSNAKIMESAFFGTPEPLLAIPSIDGKTYVDLGFSYEIGDGVVARFGINNVTDTEPPLLAEQGSANNTEPGLFDLFGRSYYLSFSAQF